MTHWKLPPKIKIYEALSAVGRCCTLITDVGCAVVFSSHGDREYQVYYDLEEGEIVANDNASYWQGYLGYPAIAVLLELEVLDLNEDFARALKRIDWKELNDKYRRNYDKVLEVALEQVEEQGFSKEEVRSYVDQIYSQLEELDLGKYPKKLKPTQS